MSMTVILLIITAAVLLLPAFRGYVQGFLRTILGVGSIVLTMVLVPVIQPVVRDVMSTRTPLETTIESAIEGSLSQVAQKALQETSRASLPSLSSIPLTEEVRKTLSEAIPLPKELDQYLEKNVSGSVEAFVQNISRSLTTTVLDAGSYVLTFLVIFVILRILTMAFGIVNHIPLLGGLNRILGAVLGLAEGVLILWLLCRFATAMLPSGIGPQVMEAIAENPILSYIYNTLYSLGGHAA